MTDKEKSNDEATYLDEAFVCAAAHHPELLRGLSPEKRRGVRTARLLYDGINVRPLPSTRSTILFAAKKDDTFAYLGEKPNRVRNRTADRKTAFVFKKYVSLQ